MAYVLFTRSYGVGYAGTQVKIYESSTGKPAILLESATGGVINTLGNYTLDTNGYLSVYVDGTKTFSAVLQDSNVEYSSGGVVYISPSEVSTKVGLPGITYIINEPPFTRYYWNGLSLSADAAPGEGESGGRVTSLNGRTGAVIISKSDVGLQNVDNTSDLNKPISTATQTALNSKLNASAVSAFALTLLDDTTATAFKTTLGLNNVSNTSDALKPISAATQAALDLKLNSSGVSNFALSLLDDIDAPSARTTLGLGNVNNTSDANKPISTATQAALNTKLTAPSIVTPFGTSLLSVADVTELKTALGLENVNNTSDANKPISTAVQAALDSISSGGGGLVTTPYTEDFLTATSAAQAKTKLGINAVNNTADVDKPISTATQSALDLKLNASAISIFGLSLVDDTSALAARTTLGLSNVDNTSDANKPVSAAQQAALNLKLNTSAISSYALTLLDDANATEAKATLGIGNINNTADVDKPISTATQTALNLKLNSSAVSAFALTLLDDLDATAFKTTLGLQNVSNTSDANKPVSTAVQSSLNAKLDASLVTPFALTLLDDLDLTAFKTTLGLQNVDNTSDSSKPVSTSVQSALNLKLNSSAVSAFALTLLDDVDAATFKTTLGIGNVDNTSDANKPISSATQAALNAKLNASAVSGFALTVLDDGDSGTMRTTLGLENVNNTSDANKPISIATQAALNAKLSTSAVSTFALTLLDDVDSTAARTTLGLGSVNNTSDANKPISTATQSALNALDSRITAIESTGGGLDPGSISSFMYSFLDDPDAATARTTLGLGNVSNTSDANKPISTATQTALNLKLNSSAVSAFALTLLDDIDAATMKTTLGLENVNNTSDANKVVSTATQAALDLKLNSSAVSAFALTVLDDIDAASMKTTLGLNNVSNTSDANKPISTATQNALNAKQDLLTAGTGIAIVGNVISYTGGGGGGGSGITDGNKGDITVAGSGTTWTINNSSVPNSKLANAATGTLKGRVAAGTGAVSDLTASDVKTLLAINNVDNTSDVNKPISTAVQTQLNYRPLGVKKGVKVTLFGSSPYSRNHRIIAGAPGNVTGNGTLMTVNTTTPHDLHTGAKVFLACSYTPTSAAFDKQWVSGTITRTGPSQYTIPYSGLAGTNAEEWNTMTEQMFAPAGWFNRLNMFLGGVLELVANYGIGGQLAENKLLQYQDVYNTGCDMVIANFGSGNAIGDDSQDLNQLIIDCTTMITYLTSRGVTVVFELASCVPSTTPSNIRRATLFNNAMWALEKNNRHLILVDAFSVTGNPLTGVGKPELFSDTLHENMLGNRLRAMRLAKAIQPLVPPPVNPLIFNINDRVEADAGSDQICNFGWDSTFINANTFEAKFSGEVDEAIVSLNGNGSGSSGVLSRPMRPDNIGREQVLVWTGPANSLVGFGIAGKPGATMASRLVAGKTYACFCDWELAADSGVVKEVTISIVATMTYAGNTNVTATLAADLYAGAGVGEPNWTGGVANTSYFAPFTIPASFTGATFFGFNVSIRLASAGTIKFRISRPTVRVR